MPLSLLRGHDIIESLRQTMSEDDFRERLRPKPPSERPLPRHLPRGTDSSDEARQSRVAYLDGRGIATDPLTSDAGRPDSATLHGNIENLVGTVQVPLGVVGPLRINGLHANGDFYVPLATTEGAMIASYDRGAAAISHAGGAAAVCLNESVLRSPCFRFPDLVSAGRFINWLADQRDWFDAVVASTTRHGKLVDARLSINNATVFLICEYTTGDAAGQNMVTVATDALCREILARSPIQPQAWYLEGNLSGDKKARMLAFLGARGKKVVAETHLPRRAVRALLHSTPERMVDYHRTSVLGGIQSGAIGVQGHVANALAGLFIACGQDVACVAEAAVGITSMEVAEDGCLHVTLSLPNLIVGTVGGGTHLPTARACLDMLGCRGEGTAATFAEIAAVTAMAGEISIIAALAAGHFGQAHAALRHKAEGGST